MQEFVQSLLGEIEASIRAFDIEEAEKKIDLLEDLVGPQEAISLFNELEKKLLGE